MCDFVGPSQASSVGVKPPTKLAQSSLSSDRVGTGGRAYVALAAPGPPAQAPAPLAPGEAGEAAAVQAGSSRPKPRNHAWVLRVRYFLNKRSLVSLSIRVSRVVVYLSSQMQAILVSPALKYWVLEALLKHRQPSPVNRLGPNVVHKCVPVSTGAHMGFDVNTTSHA